MREGKKECKSRKREGRRSVGKEGLMIEGKKKAKTDRRSDG